MLVFLQVEWDDSLEQFLTASRGKTYEEKLERGGKFWPSKPKLGLKLGFLPFSQVWLVNFPDIA